MARELLLVSAAVLALPALAATEGPGMDQRILAARAAGPIRTDGRLDEPDWDRAPVFDSFVQQFPKAGAAPTERTVMRVLYDDKNLYVGFVMLDSEPAQIVRRLGRRDRVPTSDTVEFEIDSQHDHRTAYLFQVNAGGVMMDALLYEDNQSTAEWDAVWDAAVASRPDGWSAEVTIPLHILRFPAVPVQTWGFAAKRTIARKHEEILSVAIPRDASGVVSRFGHLTGLENLKPDRDVELTPYAAARAVIRPQFSDEATPLPRLVDPSADIGLDAKVALSSELTLNATVNPDFGQVEADQVILNLTNAEQFFPEKRTFFTQGMDLFQPVGAEEGRAPQMLFYSRRIGLESPILAAGKVTGSAPGGVQVGVFDALVAGTAVPDADEVNPDRRLGLYPMRPFHLGLNDELPEILPVPENYFVGVARRKLTDRVTASARVTSAIPFTRTCTAEEAALDDDELPTQCRARGGNAGALDWYASTSDQRWVFLGQLAGAQVVGGPPERTLRDGTVLHRGDTGLGLYLRAGKQGGEPLRFNVDYNFSSPTLDLNAAGFQQIQNFQQLHANVRYVRPSGLGPLHDFSFGMNVSANASTEGRWLQRGRSANLFVNVLLPSFDFIGSELGIDDPQYDLREIDGAGIPYRRLTTGYWVVYWSTDSNRPVTLNGFLANGLHPKLDGSLQWGWGGELTLGLRPQDRVETRLTATVDYTPHGARWVEDSGGGSQTFGNLDAYFLSVTLRQQLVLTPKLTLQAYAQLFSAYGLYGPFYTAMSQDRSAIEPTALMPTLYSGDNPSFHTSQLNLNVVLRWEYRLGSTLFLVYTRSQTELPTPDGESAPATLLPQRLLAGRATDAFLVKWSYWWDV